ncbi:MAG: hypothetical protein LQ352_005569 [Teloschistes flavicans]|nr:MAG: hypothetical protein LQ352_005569 [Teloschistes flavicans]
MKRAGKEILKKATEGNRWKKFVRVSVNPGNTVWPKAPAELEAVGVRWDYVCEVARADGVYHKFKIQANKGKIPQTIQEWAQKNGGTHAVMAEMFVKKDGTKEDVEEGIRDAFYEVIYGKDTAAQLGEEEGGEDEDERVDEMAGAKEPVGNAGAAGKLGEG